MAAFRTSRLTWPPPETRAEPLALWRYLASLRPWLFWEWHSNNWHRRPGHVLIRYRHELCRDGERRRLWDAIDERLLARDDTHHEIWTSPTEGHSQGSLGYQAVTRLGSIACIVKQHERFTLDEARGHAVACLQIAIDEYRRHRPSA